MLFCMWRYDFFRKKLNWYFVNFVLEKNVIIMNFNDDSVVLKY